MKKKPKRKPQAGAIRPRPHHRTPAKGQAMKPSKTPRLSIEEYEAIKCDKFPPPEIGMAVYAKVTTGDRVEIHKAIIIGIKCLIEDERGRVFELIWGKNKQSAKEIR